MNRTLPQMEPNHQPAAIYRSESFLNYNCIDKSMYFYQFKAFVFYGSQIVGFAGFDGFYDLSPHFQDWNS
jgi:hypothetical protein